MPVSFRGRLTLFFVLIVVIPMIAIGFLVVEVAGDSATGKTDAALSEDLDLAARIYDSRVIAAREAGTAIAEDAGFQRALSAGDGPATRRALRRLAAARGVRAYRLSGSAGLAEIGSSPRGDLFAAATIRLAGGVGGELSVSTTLPEAYLRAVTRASGEDAALLTADGELAASIEIDAGALPAAGEAASFDGSAEELRIAVADLPGPSAARVALIAPVRSEGFLASAAGVAVGIAGFILVALFAAALVSRTLQGQVAAMLDAARRIGRGDFGGEVPVVGRDEMAALAGEFNEMRDRLAEQVEQLKRQRTELERSVDRIGEAFASGLDVSALLPILTDTATAACEAEYAVVALSGAVGGEHETRPVSAALRDTALAAEREALSAGGLVKHEDGGGYAIAGRLGRLGEDRRPLGVMTIARAGHAFTPEQESVFLYLLGQAAASVENVALHELVSEQAVTDELTGLPNSRAFREAIDNEAARAARFGHRLSLLILDIDHFKRVNDTYGHPQGDAVLRAIGGILAAESRAIDTSARYGGEEFVLALPETDSQGALEVAERIRARIEAEPIPVLGDDDGERALSVTASFGVATIPDGAADAQTLIAAADAALYIAKRAGRNRVELAEGNGGERRTVAQ